MKPELPPIRQCAGGACLTPTLIIDTREQTPLFFTRLPSIQGTLVTGDYSFVSGEDHFAIERKSISDLVSCCAGDNRSRFERELHRLRGFHFKRLLVIGSRADIEQSHYRSQINPGSVLGSLAAWEARYEVPVVFAATPESGAEMVEEWAWWFAREWILNINRLVTKRKDGSL